MFHLLWVPINRAFTYQERKGKKCAKLSYSGVILKIRSLSHPNGCSAIIPILKMSDLIIHDFIWFSNYISYVSSVIYVFIIFEIS